MSDLNSTTQILFQTSTGIFWAALPVVMLLCMLSIYASGEISGAKFEGLFRRLFIAIALLVGFTQISSAIQGLEGYLINAFGGDDALIQMFSKIGDKAQEIKESNSGSWFKIGQIGLSLISTVSFLVLAVVKRFLDVLHLSIWNLLHVLGPLALLGCLAPSFIAIPKGIFMGMLELALWKPVWVILARILLAIGFAETPADLSQWFDTAVLNFAVAGLMATTPILVHAFLSGQIASLGGATVQTMISGAGTALSRLPMTSVQSGVRYTKEAAASVARTPMRFFSRKEQPKPISQKTTQPINKRKE